MVSVAETLPIIEPTKPTLVREPFHRPGWVYEEKYDGWRIVAYNGGDPERRKAARTIMQPAAQRRE